MKKKEAIVVFLLLTVISLVFFYKTVLFGLVPFPSDLLIAEYNPWKTYSFLGYSPGSFPNKAQYFDVLRQLYPWKLFAIEQLKMGEIPLWNPYNFSGAPLLANFQSAVFYPLNIRYFIFPFLPTWVVLVFIQPLLAGFFTYLYARKIGISSIASLFSSISYAFSLFMMVWLEYSTIGQVILWLPLSLFAIESLLEKREIKLMILYAFSLVFPLLAGHPQIFAYSFLFTLIYIWYRTKNKSKELKIVFTILSILALGISAIQLIPGIELIQNAARSSHDYEFLINKILIQPWQLVMLFVPDFFGNPATRNYYLSDTYVGKATSIGLVALLFVFLTLLKRKEQYIRFFWGTSLTVLIFATSNPIAQILYKFEIPFISSSSPTLSIFLLCFSFSILSGFGVDIWRKEASFKKFIKSSFPLIILFTLLWISVLLLQKFSLFEFSKNVSITIRNLAYSTGILVTAIAILGASVVRRRYFLFFLILLLFLQTADLFRSFHKFNPFSPKETVFQSTSIFSELKKIAGIDRFWGYGFASVDANFATSDGLYSPDGYDPLYPKRYGEFIQSSRDGKIHEQFTVRTRSDATLAPGFGWDDLRSNEYRLRVLDVLGVKYLLDRVENGEISKIYDEDRFKLIKEIDGWRILENKFAAPRAFLTNGHKVYKDIQTFEKLFFAKDFDPKSTILLEEELPISLSKTSKSEVNSVFYTPNKVEIYLYTNANSLLFLSDVFYPGWKVLVDGVPSKLYRANYAFRAVYVPAGAKKVVFLYDPLSFKLGVYVSLGSLLILLIFVLNKRQVYNRAR